jgi:hypothetical protein
MGVLLNFVYGKLHLKYFHVRLREINSSVTEEYHQEFYRSLPVATAMNINKWWDIQKASLQLKGVG